MVSVICGLAVASCVKFIWYAFYSASLTIGAVMLCALVWVYFGGFCGRCLDCCGACFVLWGVLLVGLALLEFALWGGMGVVVFD